MYLHCMQNDSHTTNSIEDKNIISGIAGQLTKYGFATVTTENLSALLRTLEGEFNIKAYDVPRPKGVLKDGQYFIKETEK